MAIVTYPTDIDIQGPWLLSREDLIELDKIIDNWWVEISKLRAEKIEQIISAKIVENEKRTYKEDAQVVRNRVMESYEFKNFGKYLTLYCGDDAKIKSEDGSFFSVINDLSQQAIVASSFDLRLRCLEFDAKIQLKNTLNKLEITISPEHTTEVQRLFLAVRDWARERQPSKLKTLWQSGGLAITWLMFSLFTILIFFDRLTTGIGTPKAQGRDLIQNGISKGDEHKVLELLLKIESNYSEGTVSIDSRFWYLILLLLIVFIALLIRPGNILGIGKGEAKIYRWSQWVSLLKLSISAIGIYIFAPYVYDIIKVYLPRAN